ncbi:LexA family transcriptional regulator [Acinetobacter sp. ANC 4945]|uniref:DNA-binding protein n=1 Tax=Acinetobacter amyesii TaxID=2942470 RepID=A0A1T1H6R0_9GAMM|nr:XRE family transcriptional regulator [Acinetobacter amyesii]MCL6246500.1 LexA family transcriptional regulator [Acinetobacter amyesii]OOV85534.1 DNA-binding protein [Acinetobacter amyesii]
MSSIGTRIKSLRKSQKLTLKQLSAKIGPSDVAISQWENDVNVPKHEHLNSLAETFNTTIDYIMYGISETSDNVKDYRPITRMLPVLTYIQCGNMTNVRSIQPHEVDRWLPAPPEAGKNSFYLICQGISNSPEFNDGDFICIDPDWTLDCVQTGEMIVVFQDDEATFKALVREFNTLYLKALNPNFQPNIIPLKENALYRGKYVGKFTPSKKFL